MASRKPARATSGQTKTDGSQTKTAGSSARSGSGNSRRSSGTSAATGARNGGQARADGQSRSGAQARNSAQTRNGAQARNGGPARSGGQARAGQEDRRRGDRPGPGGATTTQVRATGRLADQGAVKVPAAWNAPPLWVQITALVLSLAGLGVSIYLTIAHYTSTSILSCPDKGYINCAKVTTSAESVVFGIFPVAVLGLAFYVFMVAINTPWAWRWQQPLIPWLRTAGIIAGIGFVLYLVYAEVIEIGNLCLWCTTVHGITFLLFVLLMSVAPFFRSKELARPAR
jgi:uncharacterized membrane protein